MNRKVLKIKQNIIVLCLVSLSVWALSCNRTDIEEEYIGKSGFLVTLADDISVETRSTPSQLDNPLTTDFNLKIVRTSTDMPVYDGKYKEELIQASAGFYDVTAWFGENPVLAVDAPYYWGTVTGVEVKKDTPAEVSVSCKVANALLSVVYDESIAKIYDSYYVTVSVGGESREIRDNQSAYFRAGSVATVAFHGVLKGESEEYVFELQHEGLLAPLGAAEHAVLNLSIEAGVMVSVEKLDIETVTVSETIPLEYLPKPKLESTDFVENELSFAETETKSAVINLKLSSPLQDLKLKFNSSDAKFAGLVADKEYVLSNADDKVAVETALGITLPEIGVSEGSIDFSSLIPQLMTDAGNTVLSTIEVDVKANNRWSSEDEAANRVYTLKCNKPEFSVQVSSGNIWTKEFTIDGCQVHTGNFETISSRVTYQYRKKGDIDWIDCGHSRLVKFDVCPSDKQYEIRAVYREGIETNLIMIELEEPLQLPNSGMEEWNIESLKLGGNYYHYNPWSSGEQDIWWATNNDRAADPPVSAVQANSCPSVSYVTGRNGRAAQLRTTAGSHYAHTNKTWWMPGSPHLYPEGIVSGMLFIGQYTWENHENEIVSLGHLFNSRPTKMQFYYKYQPLNSDEFKAYIELQHISVDGEVLKIASGTFLKQSDVSDDEFKLAEIPLEFYIFNVSATHIYVHFWSTTKTSFSSNDVIKDFTVNLQDVNSGWKAHVGSHLTIDDISLVYDK